jgi:hypothetical protein
MKRLRKIHTWLGVFFSPLLLLFIATGWWQTFATEDTKDHGDFNGLMSKFSDIHTSDYFSHVGGHAQASKPFQIFVGVMAAMMMVTIVLGLVLACRSPHKMRWMALAFFLGIAIPVLMLYFN